MKPGSKGRRLAGIVAVAIVTAACTASPPLAGPAPDVACTTLPTARAPVVGTRGQGSPLDMPPVPGSWLDVAVLSATSALAVGATHSAVLVAQWNGAVWRALSDPALPRLTHLGSVAVFPGGGWVVGEYGLTDHGDGGGIGRPLIVRVTGTTMRRVPVPKLAYSSTLEDVAASSATDAWAVGSTGRGPLVLHWNGTAWTRTRLPAAVAPGVPWVSALAATSTATWAVVGTRTGRSPRLARWDGRQWGDVAVIPDIGMRYGINHLAATSATNVWAIGGSVILHWNGRRWTCALTNDNLYAVSTSSAASAWAAGFSGYGSWAVAWHWNGHGWKQVMTPQLGLVSELVGVAAIPRSGGAWAVGNADTKTLMLHWNGTAWR